MGTKTKKSKPKGKPEGTLVGGDNLPATKGQTDVKPYFAPLWANGFLQRYEFEDDDVIDVNAPEIPDEIKALVDAEITPDFPPTFFFEKAGDFLRGIYRGKRENVGPNGSNVHLIEVGEGEMALKVAVWGKTSIDIKLDKVKPGQKIFIQLMGMKPGKFSNDWYNFRVATLK